MSKLQKRYTKTEKLEIVSLSMEEDQSIKDLAVRFWVSENTIYNWRSTYATHKDASFPGKGNKTMSESERKIAKLEKLLRERDLEVEILKKSSAHFLRYQTEIHEFIEAHKSEFPIKKMCEVSRCQ